MQRPQRPAVLQLPAQAADGQHPLVLLPGGAVHLQNHMHASTAAPVLPRTGGNVTQPLLLHDTGREHDRCRPRLCICAALGSSLGMLGASRCGSCYHRAQQCMAIAFEGSGQRDAKAWVLPGKGRTRSTSCRSAAVRRRTGRSRAAAGRATSVRSSARPSARQSGAAAGPAAAQCS